MNELTNKKIDEKMNKLTKNMVKTFTSPELALTTESWSNVYSNM